MTRSYADTTDVYIDDQKNRLRKGNDSEPFFDSHGEFVKRYFSLDFDIVDNYHKLHNRLAGKTYAGKVNFMYPIQIDGQKIANISFEVLSLPDISESYKAGDEIYPEFIDGPTLGEVITRTYMRSGFGRDYVRNTFLQQFQWDVRIGMEKIMATKIGKKLSKEIFNSFWIENVKYVKMEDTTLHFIITDLGGSIFHLINSNESIKEYVDSTSDISYWEKLKNEVRYYVYKNLT